MSGRLSDEATTRLMKSKYFFYQPYGMEEIDEAMILYRNDDFLTKIFWKSLGELFKIIFNLTGI